jgi:Glycosyl hydrolases family 32 N-terminal domain
MTAAGTLTHVGYRMTPASPGLTVDPLFSVMHRSDRSRVEVRDTRSVRVGFGIALVLGGPDDGTTSAPAVRYALPYAEILEDGTQAFVLGNPPADPGALDPGSVPVTVTLDGRDAPLASRTPPDPAAAIARLAATGDAVPPGAFVLTGWLAELKDVEPGFAAADLGPAGRVSCRIAEPGSPAADDRPRWGETVGPHREQAPISIGAFVEIYEPQDAGGEQWCLNDHCFVKGPDGLWHVFGITHPKPYNHALDPGTRLAHATAGSLDQRGWRQEPFALVADPSEFDEHLLWAPHVVERDGTFHMFVCTGAASGDLFAIRRYESDDLWSWRRTQTPPAVVDGVEARDPMVLRGDDGWIMYYTATERPDGGRFVVAAVTSDDLVNWSARRIVFTHPRPGAFGGPTESPFVVRRGPAYYLFVTDDEIVNVYAGRDPFRWSVEDHVFAYRGRACEVVRDETGAWFVSHVGWELGGLAIAPLEWRDGFNDGPFSIAPGAMRLDLNGDT